ncbi:MAG TPA: SRPBCC domain-containing protein [Acidimicrobiales bacterium]|nr:SRPBCC domain-containing protein [Acidimicrobiales bacterium]
MPGTEDVVDRQIRIEAPPEVVFDYFVDPVRMVSWIGTKVELDAAPGGHFRVDMNGRDIASGRFVEVVHPSRVVFSWGWEQGGAAVPPGSSTVEVTLTPDGDATIVRLVHRDLPGPTVAPHDEGWAHYLARLAAVASGHDPGPGEWAG